MLPVIILVDVVPSANRSRNLLPQILTSVAGTLLVAGVYWVIKSRWLYVVAPKLYMNTPLSNGQIVSLSIYNAGLLSEEDVSLTMRPACRFEVVATSKSTVTIQGKTILIPKLARLETITVLILVEGKAFEHEDIESIESKATHGKIVASKDKATSAWQNSVALPIILLLLGLPFSFGTVIGADMKQSIFGYVADKYEVIGPSKQLAGFKQTVREDFAFGTLKGALDKSRVSITTKEVVRRGDVLTLMINVKNNSGAALMAEGSAKGTAGEGPLSYRDSRVDDFALADGENKTIKLMVYLPESANVKLIEGTYRLKGLDGGSLTIQQILQFD